MALHLSHNQPEPSAVDANGSKYRTSDVQRHLPIYPRTYLPTYLRTDLPTYLPTYLPNYLPTYLPTDLPTYLPLSLLHIIEPKRPY